MRFPSEKAVAGRLRQLQQENKFPPEGSTEIRLQVKPCGLWRIRVGDPVSESRGGGRLIDCDPDWDGFWGMTFVHEGFSPYLVAEELLEEVKEHFRHESALNGLDGAYTVA